MTEYFFGNPRASRLKGKDLAKEFGWYEQKPRYWQARNDAIHAPVAFYTDQATQ
jgi:hypothetical protein